MAREILFALAGHLLNVEIARLAAVKEKKKKSIENKANFYASASRCYHLHYVGQLLS